MVHHTVTNPLTGRTIRVGGDTFNRLTFSAYDYINGELIRRESAPPISPREYYYNVITGRRILACGRRYYELIRAGWDILEDYYLIPPYMDDEDAQLFINIDRRRRGLAPIDLAVTTDDAVLVAPMTYERIMDTHGDILRDLNISLCRECFIPIKPDEGEYCKDCAP